MASKKTTCDGVGRKVAGKTREEILEAIYVEFDLPRPNSSGERSGGVAKPAPAPKKEKP